MLSNLYIVMLKNVEISRSLSVFGATEGGKDEGMLWSRELIEE